MRLKLVLAVVPFALSAAGTAAAADQNAKASPKPAEAVATLGDTAITEAHLEELARDRLMRLRNEEYRIKRQVLEEYITRFLLEKEAKVRGVSVDELQKSEINDKILPVSEEQKRAVYESNPQQFQGKTEAEAFTQIEANLRRVRTAEARDKLMSLLRTKTPVRVLLEPPRVNIETGSHPSTGLSSAPVTIVEFSDFQCPACGTVYPTIKRLMQQYEGKIRLVFRDFPLSIHPQAPKAAEAAACANEQGRFWEMHDRLFTNQQKLAVADLKTAASDLGLDAARFNACLDSGRLAGDWQADMAEGRKLGVSATPTFFINGRMVSGAALYQNFAAIIDEELQRPAATKP